MANLQFHIRNADYSDLPAFRDALNGLAEKLGVTALAGRTYGKGSFSACLGHLVAGRMELVWIEEPTTAHEVRVQVAVQGVRKARHALVLAKRSLAELREGQPSAK